MTNMLLSPVLHICILALGPNKLATRIVQPVELLTTIGRYGGYFLHTILLERWAQWRVPSKTIRLRVLLGKFRNYINLSVSTTMDRWAGRHAGPWTASL